MIKIQDNGIHFRPTANIRIHHDATRVYPGDIYLVGVCAQRPGFWRCRPGVAIDVTDLRSTAFGVDLQIVSALLLVPVTAIGHFFGLWAHDYMQRNDRLFKRVLGSILIAISAVGLGSLA